MRPTLLPAAALALIAACAAPMADTPSRSRSQAGPAEIVLSSGQAGAGGYILTVTSDDRVVGTEITGAGRAVGRSDTIVPGAYRQLAAVLARHGPALVAQQGHIGAPCRGSLDRIVANPPVGHFESITVGCPGGEAQFEALFHLASTAVDWVR